MSHCYNLHFIYLHLLYCTSVDDHTPTHCLLPITIIHLFYLT